MLAGRRRSGGGSRRRRGICRGAGRDGGAGAGGAKAARDEIGGVLQHDGATIDGLVELRAPAKEGGARGGGIDAALRLAKQIGPHRRRAFQAPARRDGLVEGALAAAARAPDEIDRQPLVGFFGHIIGDPLPTVVIVDLCFVAERAAANDVGVDRRFGNEGKGASAGAAFAGIDLERVGAGGSACERVDMLALVAHALGGVDGEGAAISEIEAACGGVR